MGCGCAERRKKVATVLKKVAPASKMVERYYVRAHAAPTQRKKT
jgi:hypothetical protein